MDNSKKTRKALLASIMALALCFVMLIGTTFAWFTDTATTGVNKIQAGELDVDIQDAQGNSLAGQTLNFVKADGHESEPVLWEPGCTYNTQPFYIKNDGNLNLKFKFSVSGIQGDAKLLEAIDFTAKAHASWFKFNTGAVSIGTDGEFDLFKGFDVDTLFYGTKHFDEYVLEPGEKAGPIVISGHMKEEAGNEYQNLSIDGIAITLVATQATGEEDSFNGVYDADATYPWDGVYVTGATAENRKQPESFDIDPTTQTITIKDAAALAYLNVYNDETMYQWDYNDNFHDNSVYYYTWEWTVKLDADIDLGNMPWKPISFGYKEFDGQGHTISNVNVNVNVTDGSAGLFSEAGNVHDLTVKNVKVNNTATEGLAPATGGVIGNCAGKVKNVSLINATVTGKKYVGGIVGYGYADIQNCLVDGAEITNTGHKDVGGIIGFNADPCTIINNKVINTTLTNTSTNDEKNIGAIVGRWNFPQKDGESCTFEGNSTTTAYDLIGKAVNGTMPTQS